MARSSQDSESSTRASHNYRIRRGHNSENRRTSHGTRIQRGHSSENHRTSHGTEHLHSPVRRRIHRSGYPSQISFHFTVCFMPTHAARPQYLRTSVEGVQTPAAGQGSSGAGYHQQSQNAGHNIGPAPSLHTDVAGPEYPRIPRDWRYPQPSGGLYNGGFTSGAQMNAVWPGSFTGGYNPGEPGASLIPGVQTPAVGLGPARSSGVGYNQPTPNATWGFGGQTLQAPLFPEYDTQPAAPPAVGLNNGGLTSGAQMNAVWPGSVTGGYNPGEPGASLTPGVQTPAVGLGPARSSGVGYNQPTPNATLGFAGQTSQAPLFPEYDTQAAAPPLTLDQLLFPPSSATAANNDYAEHYFLPPAVSDNFMHMVDQIV